MYRNFLFISIIMLLSISRSWSQSTVTAQAFAEVIEALAANEDKALNFGRFTTGSGGSVIITPDGLRTVRGTVMPAGEVYSPGRYLITGASGTWFTISLPGEETVLVHQQSGNTMQVNGWISDPPSDDAANLADGSRVVSIGATLNIGNIEKNPAGLYAGSFVLIFAYN